LPGKVRQQIRRAIDALATEPRPAHSKPLNLEGLDVPAAVEVHRLQLDRWRIVYAVNEDEKWVWVLAVRQRPPYNYEDLEALLKNLE